jgi:hypothetical protein
MSATAAGTEGAALTDPTVMSKTDIASTSNIPFNILFVIMILQIPYFCLYFAS